MDELEKAITETLQRTNLFGIENAAAIAANAKAVSCFALIQEAVDELESRGILRASAIGTRFSATERRAIKRHSYIMRISKISTAARDIARTDETFVNKFRRPRSNRSDLSWLETGRAFAADLPAVKDKFMDYGFLPTFIADLIAETDEFEAVINEQSSATGQRIDANASIDSILGQALKALRTLKIIIPIIFDGNPGKLAEWASASHIEKKTPTPRATQPTAPVQ